MAGPRYRFIPFAFQEELAEQLAKQTPVPGKGSLYIYDFTEPHEARDVVEKQMAEEIKQWAEANEKVIMNPVYAPKFFRLKKGATTVWTEKGATSLLVPLFKGTMDVLVCVRDSDTKYQIQWDCGFVLHLDGETGIRSLTGDLIFHYNHFRLGVGPAAREAAGQEMAGQEGEVDETS